MFNRKLSYLFLFSFFCLLNGLSLPFSPAWSQDSNSYYISSGHELSEELTKRLERVEEFREIQKMSEEMGVSAYLFGGTAAAFAHYVKWDLLREKGDPRFQADRFDYDYTNIFRSNQDMDIVIDGTPEQAAQLEAHLAQKFPFFQGNKTVWEVRLLKGEKGDKEALLNNPDYLNQHTDSNSTGMIEITGQAQGKSPADRIRDLRDWDNTKDPHFFEDVRKGELHYYFSNQHAQTKRFKEGLNPPILSVIRYLTKAFQYELDIPPSSLNTIKKIITDWDEKKFKNESSYVQFWVEKNAKKLIQNAVNIEYAQDKLKELGLGQKLGTIGNQEIGGLGWWMKKEPLRSFEVGQGKGKTAQDLGITIVAHETRSFDAYESMTRAHTGEPNVLISRGGFPDEAAFFGDGFYTAKGKFGMAGTGITIRFQVHPQARNGKDFIDVGNGIVIFLNKKALRVIPETMKLTNLEYFQKLSRDEIYFDYNDKAVEEKVKRKLRNELTSLSEEDFLTIKDIVRDSFGKKTEQALLQAWLKLPPAQQHPDIFDDWLAQGGVNSSIIENFFAPMMKGRPEEEIVSLIKQNLQKNDYNPDHPAIIREWLKLPFKREHPEIFQEWLKRGNLEKSILLEFLKDPQEKIEDRKSVFGKIKERKEEPNFRSIYNELEDIKSIALVNALEENDLDFARFLIENKSGDGNENENENENENKKIKKIVNGSYQNPITPLMAAAKNGFLDMVKELFRKGAQIDRDSSSDVQAIDLAAENGHKDIVQFLLKNGANKDLGIALSRAARNGHFEIVRLLQELLLEHPEKENFAFLSSAIGSSFHSGHLSITKYLLEKNLTNPKKCSELENSLSSFADNDKNNDDDDDDDGKEAIWMEETLEKMENLCAHLNFDWYPSLINAAKVGNINFIRLLSKRKNFNINQAKEKTSSPDSSYGYPAIAKALNNGQTETVRYLLDLGADPNAKYHGKFPAYQMFVPQPFKLKMRHLFYASGTLALSMKNKNEDEAQAFAHLETVAQEFLQIKDMEGLRSFLRQKINNTSLKIEDNEVVAVINRYFNHLLNFAPTKEELQELKNLLSSEYQIDLLEKNKKLLVEGKIGQGNNWGDDIKTCIKNEGIFFGIFNFLNPFKSKLY